MIRNHVLGGGEHIIRSIIRPTLFPSAFWAKFPALVMQWRHSDLCVDVRPTADRPVNPQSSTRNGGQMHVHHTINRPKRETILFIFGKKRATWNCAIVKYGNALGGLEGLELCRLEKSGATVSSSLFKSSTESLVGTANSLRFLVWYSNRNLAEGFKIFLCYLIDSDLSNTFQSTGCRHRKSSHSVLEASLYNLYQLILSPPVKPVAVEVGKRYIWKLLWVRFQTCFGKMWEWLLVSWRAGQPSLTDRCPRRLFVSCGSGPQSYHLWARQLFVSCGPGPRVHKWGSFILPTSSAVWLRWTLLWDSYIFWINSSCYRKMTCNG